MDKLRPLLVCFAFAFGCVSPVLAQERIVALGGDVTEILYELGEGDRIVANDSTSVYPEDAQAKPKVGYVRQLSAEGVLSAQPDLILISGAAGPPAALELIEASGVEIIQMETEYTIDAILEKTQRIGEVLEIEEEAGRLAGQIASDWQDAEAQITALDLSPTVLFFATLNDGAPRAAGTETAAHGIIELMGGSNLFDTHTGYQALSLESAVAADPDIILVMSHHAARIGGVDSVVSHPAISLTRAAQTEMIFLVDPVTVMQFSPRTPAAIAELATRIDARVKERDAS